VALRRNVFVSHARGDADVAATLAARLERAGFKVFTAVNIPVGANWALMPGHALEEADFMIVLISPESMSSQSVRREIDYALTSPRLEGRVLPIMVRKTKDYPWILENLHVLDLDRNPARAGDLVVRRLKQIDDAA
jgi:hypothetical protein